MWEITKKHKKMDVRPKASEIKKYLMWSKINELKREGHSISRIKKLTGLDRKTIRKYLAMSEEEFRGRNCCVRVYSSRLDKYRGFIVERLGNYPFLSTAAIHSQLRLNFPDLEKFDQKTVYNYVMRVRREENIPLEKEGNNRPYSMLEQTAPGEYAQADFGEKWIEDKEGNKKKVYFFVMLMSRWRHKFVWFSDKPFTSELAAYAHELAFEFFGGVPHNIVYDQDKVFIKEENMGDYVLTQRFRKLVKECGFHPVFCRKADPESKGKVENAVKYVKGNFLAGYEFTSMEQINRDCLAWLDTTANGLPNATTGMIPSAMFESEEREFLLQYGGIPTPPAHDMPTYVLRKDNTVSYKGNYYAVPLGSYTGRGSAVRIKEKDGEVEIYSVETGKLLMQHPLETEKGKLVTNTSCRRNPDQRIKTLEEGIMEWMGHDSVAKLYIATIRKAFPRNVRDNLSAIDKTMREISREAIAEAMRLHLDASMPGVNAMLKTARNIDKRDGDTLPLADTTPIHTLMPIPKMTPEKTPISTYAQIFN